jgi:protein Tex
LVHLSQLSNRFISDPNEVVKLNQKVVVTVTEVDVNRKRIALTMKDGERQNVSGKQGGGERKATPVNKSVTKKAEPLNPFQSKLMELKKKFKD